MPDHQEEREILSWFGIVIPEDAPWVVEQDYPESEQIMFHLLENGRGVSFDHKGFLSWIIPDIEKRLASYGIRSDLNALQEKHGQDHYVHEWLAGVNDFLAGHDMVLFFFGMLDDYYIVDFLPDSGEINFSGNNFYCQLEADKQRFLDPDNWGTWTIEDA